MIFEEKEKLDPEKLDPEIVDFEKLVEF